MESTRYTGSMTTPPQTWLVTPAVSGDATVLARFNLLLALETENIRLDEATVLSGVLQGLRRAPEVRYLVAREHHDGHALGQLMLTREWSDWRDGWIWWIQSVYVDEAFRRKGIMRSLFSAVMTLAGDSPEKVVLVRLYVEEHNTLAQAFYRDIGLKDEGYRVWACKVG